MYRAHTASGIICLDLGEGESHSIDGRIFYSFPSYRICVGKDVANAALFINIATILWASNIEAATVADGHPIVPSREDFSDGGIVMCVIFLPRLVQAYHDTSSRLAPFRCSLNPRAPEVHHMVHMTLEIHIHDHTKPISCIMLGLLCGLAHAHLLHEERSAYVLHSSMFFIDVPIKCNRVHLNL